MKNGKGGYITILHLYTNYRLTDKPIADMTIRQYNAILIISEEIMKFKNNNKPIVAI